MKPDYEDSLAGRTIGKYRIEALIGRGAMAEVYRAHHLQLKRPVAIKRLHPFLLEKPDMRERFQREAQNIAALSHPNIVQVFDIEVDESLVYMVMEYIDGDTLKSILAGLRDSHSLLPLSETARIARDVGLALAYAHARGVIHRDVKPANIMIERAGRVVLADFGLARLLSGPQYTSSGTIVGTPAYMSPEQGSGQPGDERSDIYALGALLFEMTTGLPPFPGESPIAVVFQHIQTPAPSPRASNPAIPIALERIILRALEKSPDRRYPDAREMAADIERQAASQLRQPNPAEVDAPAAASPLTGLQIDLVDFKVSVQLTGKDRYVLGRLDGAFEPDLDLGVYDGASNGVSRLHAEIEIHPDGRVMVWDMESMNGTWASGKQVSPSQPTGLNDGDTLLLGRCTLKIRFLR